MKFFKAVGIIMCLIIGLSGCADKTDVKIIEKIKSEQVDLTPKAGGEISISILDYDTLNPLLNKEKSVDEALKLVYDSLFTFDGDNNVVPKMVESYDFNALGNVLTLKLKNGIYWHDGKSFVGDDVEYTISLLKSLNDSPYRSLVSNIKSVRVLGKERVEIELIKPYAFTLEQLVFPILPKHEKENADSLVGTGMFKISKYEKRKFLYLTRYDKYYDKKPFINSVKAVIVPEKEIQENMVISLETDICKSDSFNTGKFISSKFNVQNYGGNSCELLIMNFNKDLLKNLAFRKAIMLGIDKEKIIKDVYIDKGELVNIPINSTSKYYDKTSKSSFKPNESRKIQKNMGIKDASLKLIVNSENILRVKEAYEIQDELVEVGIKVNVVELPWDNYIAALNSGDYDLALSGWKASIVPDPSLLFYSDAGVKKFINYNDPNFDIILNDLKGSIGQAQTMKNYYAFQKYINKEVPFINILQKDESLVTNNRIKGRLKPNVFNIYNGIEDVFVNY